jgi:hypothetical protein
MGKVGDVIQMPTYLECEDGSYVHCESATLAQWRTTKRLADACVTEGRSTYSADQRRGIDDVIERAEEHDVVDGLPVLPLLTR